MAPTNKNVYNIDKGRTKMGTLRYNTAQDLYIYKNIHAWKPCTSLVYCSRDYYISTCISKCRDIVVPDCRCLNIGIFHNGYVSPYFGIYDLYAPSVAKYA